MDTLLNLSGGLDSAYCTWDYLKNNPKNTLLIHHCYLKTANERHELEQMATENILQWFRDNGLGNFEYIETSFDYGGLQKLLDSTLMAVMTGIILHDAKYFYRIKNIIYCTPKDEYLRLDGGELERRQLLAHEMRDLTSRNHFGMNIIRPIKDMMKKEVWETTPKELRELIWSCRVPQEDGKYCGVCHTCLQLGNEILTEINNKPVTV